ncbi:hypothetical protein [Mesorhizobium huakuii]|uniref:hypothetical protein n=1 Tax=Mesorhizobium huakuii TaxID=28104 RepID=UPI0024E06409|nr:hypothetical protein [Mesorhizobium huakuii]
MAGKTGHVDMTARRCRLLAARMSGRPMKRHGFDGKDLPCFSRLSGRPDDKPNIGGFGLVTCPFSRYLVRRAGNGRP